MQYARIVASARGRNAVTAEQLEAVAYVFERLDGIYKRAM